MSFAAPPVPRQVVPEQSASATASNFEGVAENADKLISEANLRYLAAETVKVRRLKMMRI